MEDGGDTPKKGNNNGPRFEENEFEPVPQVRESALVNQINQQRKQMTRAEHAKVLREKKRAMFEQKREEAKQKMQSRMATSTTKETLRG